jgi:hypothetical protein
MMVDQAAARQAVTLGASRKMIQPAPGYGHGFIFHRM